MKLVSEKFILAATDLSNYLACKHLTQLSRRVALKELTKPVWNDPVLDVLMERGKEHEADYVQHLKDQGLRVIDLTGKTMEDTLTAMENGDEVLVQAKLESDDWTGYANILLRVPVKSNLGDYSYVVQDTKLAQDTRPGTILQLCLYSEFLESLQGIAPEHMDVVKPGNPFETNEYRFNDFKAYYNLVKKRLTDAVSTPPATYPDPIEHCNICAWWQVCRNQRRADDHLSLVAGIRSSQISELEKQDIHQLASFARAPEIKRPDRGNLESLLKKKDQAEIQLEGREEGLLKHEMLDVVEEHGLNRLPEPSDGDIYFDIEGDAFYEDGGLEYLLGYVYKNSNGEWVYDKVWSRNRKEEKKAFRKFMDFVMNRWQSFPGMCIYHFAPYEPSHVKRMMQTHAVAENDVAKLLRGLRFVDLYSIIKESLIASVERYSLKDLEHLALYTRKMPLPEASLARRHIECAIELGDLKSINPHDKENVEVYNEDDCRATLALHQWLEKKRNELITSGNTLVRLQLNDGAASEKVQEAETKADVLFKGLTKDLPEDRENWTLEHHALWLLAHLIDYFERERASGWWEYFLIRDMDYEDLMMERKAITGLNSPTVLPLAPRQRIPIVRYEFPPQELDIHAGDELDEIGGDKIGTVVTLSKDDWTIDIKKTGESLAIHPSSVQVKPKSFGGTLPDSLIKVAEAIKQSGFGLQMPYHAASDLLLKKRPRFIFPQTGPLLLDKEDHVDGAIRLAKVLDSSVLAIQGPPGTGKTYTGARMIIELGKAKKKIGVTAVSHKAIRNLLIKINELGVKQNVKLQLGHKSDGSFGADGIEEFKDNAEALDALDHGKIVGGTAWLWANDQAEGKLDYLFVDEAGQMSLSHVLAASRSTSNLILLGDPQQLEQPQKATHPEGSDVAALSYLLDGHKTIQDERGIFVKTTRRLHPSICLFTSEVFYENRLDAMPGLEQQAVLGNTQFKGSGLFYVPVEHKGNQSQSKEEVNVVKKITDELLQNGSWQDSTGNTRKLTKEDIKIVAPYNAQIAALKEELQDFSIGTVDKFQGQEAPVVIYSMTTSSAQDAPRGMSFLYDPHRFNVATSRALAVCILVVAPKLLEPECHSIEQMKWANAVCRFREMAIQIVI